MLGASSMRPQRTIEGRDFVRDASDVLDQSLAAADFESARIHVILGFPRSDIGKAELTARLGQLLVRDFSIIKVDGFLNTNKDGRHPSRVANDFVVYRRFHEDIAFGGHHLILNAPLMQSFFERFGECNEHLMFCPHLAKFFAIEIHNRWRALGKPSNLLIEIGGTFADAEVSAYIVPGIGILRESCPRTRSFLLTEAGFNGEGIKTRPLAMALEAARQLGMRFDVVFARLPMNFPDVDDRDHLNRYVEMKIRDSLVGGLQDPRVLCIPFFQGTGLAGYSEEIARYRGIIFPTD
jgi:CTP synthase (UTP-ammonia lyase)